MYNLKKLRFLVKEMPLSNVKMGGMNVATPEAAVIANSTGVHAAAKVTVNK